MEWAKLECSVQGVEFNLKKEEKGTGSRVQKICVYKLICFCLSVLLDELHSQPC